MEGRGGAGGSGDCTDNRVVVGEAGEQRRRGRLGWRGDGGWDGDNEASTRQWVKGAR